MKFIAVFSDQEHRIMEVKGDIAALIGAGMDFLAKGSYLFGPEWNELVEEPPSVGEETHITRLRKGGLLLFTYTAIPDRGSVFSYVLVMSRIDRAFTPLGESISPKSVEDMPTRSPLMKKIINIIQRIAEVDSTVLLLGETGVGKSMLARYIHRTSSRSKKPFIPVNCGTIPEGLMESELFGYEAGAFTGGSSKGKKGLLEAADGGMIFLDEIAELPFAIQSKLLEVLQEQTFRKVGGTKSRKVDIRVVAATNKDLQKMVEEGTFREDLYYRLNVVPLTVPPLRERPEEIIPLAEHFVQVFNDKYGRDFWLSSHTKERFLEEEWRGNIRELENTVERMVVTQSEEVPVSERKGTADTGSLRIPKGNSLPPLKEAKRQLEKELILKAYRLYGSTYKAAEILHVDQSTIAKKLKQYRGEEEETHE